MFRRRRRKDEDFSEELRAHLAIEADRLREEEGLSAEEALNAARRNLGNLTKSEERFYEASRWLWLDHLRQDLRQSFRQLRLNPGFTAAATLTLALGIGANTAIFGLVYAVMYKPLPVANPGELYRLGDWPQCCVVGGYQEDRAIFSYGLYSHLRDRMTEFDELAAYMVPRAQTTVRRAGSAAPAEPLVTELVSGNYFPMLGIRAWRGRTIAAADDTPGVPPTAMLSYRAWEQRYGLDSSIIGGTLTVDGAPVTVVGVTPPGFFGAALRADPPELWINVTAEPALRGQNSILRHDDEHWLYLVGRLKPGAALPAVQAKLNVELRQWLKAQAGSKLSEEDAKAIAHEQVHITSAARGVDMIKGQYTNGLWMLMALSGMVLLIACANIANLLLAKRTASRIQTSVRIALGAPRRRLIAQSLTESVLLAVLGGAAALPVAVAGARAIVLLAFRGSKYVPIDSTLSPTVLVFAFLLSLVTGIVFGVVPAWFASHSDPIEALRGAGRSTRARVTLSQRSLVIFQAALSLVLLSGAGILTQSLRNLERQSFGFQTEGRLIVKVNPAFTGYSPERMAGIYQRLQERLTQIPGVVSASFSLYSPMSGNNWSSGVFIEGQLPGAEVQGASWNRVSPRYFETIGTRLLRGRLLDERDTPASRHVTVVTQAFADKFFKNVDPIGRRFGLEGLEHSLDYEIVGVIEDAKYTSGYRPPRPTFFLPLMQMSAAEWKDSALARSNYIEDVELRVAGRPDGFGRRIREAIAGVDPNLTILEVLSFNEQVALNFNQERLLARLTGLFGLLALVLASVGLYGIIAYSVARRTNEIGIRIALGAARSSVIAMVLRSALVHIGFGVAIGLPAALAGGKLLAFQLYGIKSNDPLVLAGATVALTVCSLLAGFLPARRAAALDPVRALRTE